MVIKLNGQIQAILSCAKSIISRCQNEFCNDDVSGSLLDDVHYFIIASSNAYKILANRNISLNIEYELVTQ